MKIRIDSHPTLGNAPDAYMLVTVIDDMFEIQGERNPYTKKNEWKWPDGFRPTGRLLCILEALDRALYEAAKEGDR